MSKYSEVIVPASMYLSFVVHLWIVSFVWHYFEPPPWIGFPALVSCGITFILLGTTLAWVLDRMTSEDD